MIFAKRSNLFECFFQQNPYNICIFTSFLYHSIEFYLKSKTIFFITFEILFEKDSFKSQLEFIIFFLAKDFTDYRILQMENVEQQDEDRDEEEDLTFCFKAFLCIKAACWTYEYP